MSVGLYSHTTRAIGTVLTAAIYNADHTNHITNQNPSMSGAYSDSVGQMQTNTDPGGVGSESLPTNMAGEIERIRFAIKRLSGAAQWYAAPTVSMANTFSKAVDDLDDITNQNWEFMRGKIFGLTLSNNGADATNDIDIAAGFACSDAAPWRLMKLTAGITKRLDAAWAVGSGNGGLDTGAIANGTYHVWLIRRSDTGVVDALFSASATAPTMPASYDQKRRIGSIVRSAAAILAFTQNDNVFFWKTPAADVADTPGAAAVTRTLTLPTGLVIEALLALGIADAVGTTGAALYVSSLASVDIAAAPSTGAQCAAVETSNTVQLTVNATASVMTNASAQIRSRISAAGITNYIVTLGWIDTRGSLS